MPFIGGTRMESAHARLPPQARAAWKAHHNRRKNTSPRLPWVRHAAAVAGQFPANECDGDEPGGVFLVHELAHGGAGGELAREDLIELELADDVAGAVTRLLQVEVLLEPDGFAGEAEPAAWSVRGGELRGLLQRHLIRVHAQIAQGAGGALGEEDPDQLAGARA